MELIQHLWGLGTWGIVASISLCTAGVLLAIGLLSVLVSVLTIVIFIGLPVFIILGAFALL